MGPANPAATIATDRYATRPLYVTSDDGTTLVTGELKAVPAVFPARRTIDLDTAAAFLAYEHTFPRQALVQGVNALPPAVTDTIGESGEIRRTRRWRFELAPEPLADPREWVAEFGRQLDRAVARRLNPATFVTISGGLDSRCVVLSLVRQGLESFTVTYGASGAAILRTERPLPRRPDFDTVRCASSPATSRAGLRRPRGSTTAASVRSPATTCACAFSVETEFARC